MFAGCRVCVLPCKDGAALQATLAEQGGSRCFGVTPATTHVVCDDDVFVRDRGRSSRTKAASENGVPVVSTRWLRESAKQGKMLDVKPFLLQPIKTVPSAAPAPVATRKGKLTGSHSATSKKALAKTAVGVVAWLQGSPQASKSEPPYPDSWEVLTRHILADDSGNALCAEVHAAVPGPGKPPQFRVFTQHCKTTGTSTGEVHHRYYNTLEAAEAGYATLLQAAAAGMKRVVFLAPPAHIGSKPAGQPERRSSLSPELRDLLLRVFGEARTQATSLRRGVVQLADIERGEAALMEAAGVLTHEPDNDAALARLLKEFNAAVPLRAAPSSLSVDSIASLLDKCQLLRDMLGFSEALQGGASVHPDDLYQSLKADIKRLEPDSPEFQQVQRQLDKGLPDGARVANIYSVARFAAEDAFAYDVRPHRMLYHGTAARNVVGILQHGLLLPKTAVSRMGVKRSDYGFLGAGVYFSPNLAVSAPYADPGGCGRRVMFISRVAAGRQYRTPRKLPHLVAPPRGYDSVVGVASSPDHPTPFGGEEVVVYQREQFRLEYMVEFHLAGDSRPPRVTAPTRSAPAKLQHAPQLLLEGKHAMQAAPARRERKAQPKPAAPAPTPDQPSGLMTSTGQPVPLQSMHVRAQIVDLACRVLVTQQYFNASKEAIEAKFVFPVSDGAGVCGFEAYINGKHIVGKVKEKEQAHREYKKAVAEGKGAYLMDQQEDAPDVFTISVGNLPPQCEALIRITYVTELQVDPVESCVIFRMPASVTALQQQKGLTGRLQTDVRTVTALQNTKATKALEKARRTAAGETPNAPTPTRFSLEVAAEMAFNVTAVRSPSHSVTTKRVGRKAMVRLVGGRDGGGGDDFLRSDFVLQLAVSMPHASRMWVEEDPEKRHPPAAMVAFYPRLGGEAPPTRPARTSAYGSGAAGAGAGAGTASGGSSSRRGGGGSGMDTRPESWILLDRSASMEGDATALAQGVVRTLVRGLAALDVETRTQVVSFGSAHEHLCPCPVAMTSAAASQIEAAVCSSSGSWGASDLWTPLRVVLQRCRFRRQAARSKKASLVNIFLVTDGRVESSLSQCLDLLRTSIEAAGARVFVIGVGDSANTHACKALGRAGCGATEMVHQRGPRMQAACSLQLRRAMQPAVGNVTVEWVMGSHSSAVQAPVSVRTAFLGERRVVYAFADHCQRAILHGTVTALDGSTSSFSTSVGPSGTGTRRGSLLHTLAAREMIRDWDEGLYDDAGEQHLVIQKRRKQELIRLSIQYQVVTKWTSFVAIEDRTEEEKQQLAEGKGGQPQGHVTTVEELVAADSVDNLGTVPWGATREPYRAAVPKSKQRSGKRGAPEPEPEPEPEPVSKLRKRSLSRRGSSSSGSESYSDDFDDDDDDDDDEGDVVQDDESDEDWAGGGLFGDDEAKSATSLMSNDDDLRVPSSAAMWEDAPASIEEEEQADMFFDEMTIATERGSTDTLQRLRTDVGAKKKKKESNKKRRGKGKGVFNLGLPASKKKPSMPRPKPVSSSRSSSRRDSKKTSVMDSLSQSLSRRRSSVSAVERAPQRKQAAPRSLRAEVAPQGRSADRRHRRRRRGPPAPPPPAPSGGGAPFGAPGPPPLGMPMAAPAAASVRALAPPAPLSAASWRSSSSTSRLTRAPVNVLRVCANEVPLQLASASMPVAWLASRIMREEERSVVESSRMVARELDVATRETVERMMYDQRQKQMEMEIRAIERERQLHRFMAAHPEMDFSQASVAGQLALSISTGAASANPSFFQRVFGQVVTPALGRGELAVDPRAPTSAYRMDPSKHCLWSASSHHIPASWSSGLAHSPHKCVEMTVLEGGSTGRVVLGLADEMQPEGTPGSAAWHGSVGLCPKTGNLLCDGKALPCVSGPGADGLRGPLAGGDVVGLALVASERGSARIITTKNGFLTGDYDLPAEYTSARVVVTLQSGGACIRLNDKEGLEFVPAWYAAGAHAASSATTLSRVRLSDVSRRGVRALSATVFKILGVTAEDIVLFLDSAGCGRDSVLGPKRMQYGVEAWFIAGLLAACCEACTPGCSHAETVRRSAIAALPPQFRSVAFECGLGSDWEWSAHQFLLACSHAPEFRNLRLLGRKCLIPMPAELLDPRRRHGNVESGPAYARALVLATSANDGMEEVD